MTHILMRGDSAANWTSTNPVLSAREWGYETDTGKVKFGTGVAWNSTAYGLDVTAKANIASPTFTGVPAAPTASAGTSTTQIATTAFVTTADNLKANLAGPTFTGVPAAPTATAGTNTTQLATTAFVQAQLTANAYAPLASPTLTGTPLAPTPTTADNTTKIATTAFVKAQGYATLASPTFTGSPAAPTAALNDSTTLIATTAFVQNQLANRAPAIVKVTSGVGPTSSTTELIIASTPSFTYDGVKSVLIMVTGFNVTKTTAADNCEIKLYDGASAGSGTQLAAWEFSTGVTAGGGFCLFATTTPSAGAHVFTARLVDVTGTGTVSLAASSGAPTTLVALPLNF